MDVQFETLLQDLPFKHAIRMHQSTKQYSVIDVIRCLSGSNSAHAGEALKRLGREFIDRCSVIKINGTGRLTPVGDAMTIAAVILALPQQHGKQFRVKHLDQLSALMSGRDAILPALQTRELVMIGNIKCPVPLATDSPELKAKFLSLVDKAGALHVEPKPTTRDILVVGKMKCTLPLDSDLPELKARMLSMVDNATVIYEEEQRVLSNVRITKDIHGVMETSPASVEDPRIVMNLSSTSRLLNETRIMRRKKKNHKPVVESREKAIKSKPCNLSTCRLQHVYIITQRGTDMFKIGFSERPFERLSQLQTANPIPLEVVKTFHATHSDEKYLHRVYKQYQTATSNEWFLFQPGECFLL
jgi:hypothetical protein